MVEAKPAGHTLIGVEPQAERYADGLPKELTSPVRPLPFLYLSTGEITLFTNLLDPHPRSREIYHVHRPETIAEWLAAESLPAWAGSWASDLKAAEPAPTGVPYADRPSSLRSRIRHMPPPEIVGLWPNQRSALANLELSLQDDRPRALIQMATGSGKTLLAVSSTYRLIKLAGARRVLFLVDRGNLGKQAEDEFAAYRSPDDPRKFSELYKVQRLTTNTIAASAKVVICTIQRLYSILKGGPELPPDAEEGSQFGPMDSCPGSRCRSSTTPPCRPSTSISSSSTSVTGRSTHSGAVSLLRFALRRDGELVPFAERVRERFATWLAQQTGHGRHFTPEQMRWLGMIRDHIATSLEIDSEDFGYTPFVEAGGLGRASEVFGSALRPLLDELNTLLAA